MSATEFKKDIGTLARGTGTAGTGLVLQKVFAFAIIALRIRYLGIDQYGAYVVALGIAMLLMVPQNLGFPNGLIKFCVQARIDRDPVRLWAIFWSGLLFPFLLGLVFCFGFLFLAPSINKQFFNSVQILEAMNVFAIVLPILGSASMPANLTITFETNRYEVISSDIVAPLAELVLLACLLFLPSGIMPKHNIISIVIVYSIASLLSCMVAIWYFAKLCKTRNLKLSGGIVGHIKAISDSSSYIKEAIRYCLPLMMSNAFQRIIQWTDTIMIGAFLNTVSAGAYHVATRLSTLISSILGSIGSILRPIFVRYHHHNQNEMIESLYKQATRWTLIIAFPFIVVLIVFSDSFLGIFNSDAIIATTALKLLVIGQAFNLFTGNVEIVLTMAGKSFWHMINGIFITISYILFCLFLIPRFGMIGAAGATALVVIILNSMRVIESKIFFGLHCLSKTVVQTFICATAALVVLIIIRSQISLNYLENYLILAIGSTVISCIITWSVHALFCASAVDRRIVKTIISRLYNLKLN